MELSDYSICLTINLRYKVLSWVHIEPIRVVPRFADSMSSLLSFDDEGTDGMPFLIFRR